MERAAFGSGKGASPALYEGMEEALLPSLRAKFHVEHLGKVGNGVGLDMRRFDRIKEWVVVMRREGRKVSLWGKVRIGFGIVVAGLVRRSVGRGEWRRRMKICLRCPIYDGQIKRCRPMDGSPLGCGCYVPALLSLKYPYGREKPGCWGRRHLPGTGIGWE